MEASLFTLTEERVTRAVPTTVARPLRNGYLATVPHEMSHAIASEGADEWTSKVESLRSEVSDACYRTAAAVERVLDQLGEIPDRVVRTRSGGIAFVFLGDSRYAALECDNEGSTLAMLSDRSTDSEADAWEVEPGALTVTVRKIRSFLGASNAANR